MCTRTETNNNYTLLLYYIIYHSIDFFSLEVVFDMKTNLPAAFSIYNQITIPVVITNALIGFVFTKTDRIKKETPISEIYMLPSNSDIIKNKCKSAFYLGTYGYLWPITYPTTLYFDEISIEFTGKKYSQIEDEMLTYKDTLSFKIIGFNGFGYFSRVLSDTYKK